MTNVRGRAQRLQAAYPPPAGARLDSAILGYIGKSLGVEGTADPSDITDEIARTIPGYAGISYASIGDQGVLTGGAEPSEAAGG
jgi:predicted molibdopterin-dependent oxidoreductase YjgC